MHPQPDHGIAGDHEVDHRGIARDLKHAHAQARAAGHLLGVDPAAAARALRDITQHTSAALDALAATQPRPADQGTESTPLGKLLSAFNAGGGALRISVIGPAQELPLASESVIRQLAYDALDAACAHANGWDLSFSMTWSGHRLDVLAVCGPGAGERPEPVAVPPERFDDTRARVAAVGGTLRVTTPGAGGFLTAASVPVAGAALDGDPLPAGGLDASHGQGRAGARIMT